MTDINPDAEEKIKDIELQQEEKLAQQIAKANDFSYLSSAHIIPSKSALALIDKSEAQKAGVIVFKKESTAVSVAVVNPENKSTQTLLKNLQTKYEKVNIFIISEPTLNKLLVKYPKKEKEIKGITEKVKITGKALKEFQTKNTSLKDVSSALETMYKTDTSKALEVLLISSLSLNATDIHIEPQENDVVVRIKVDGILYEVGNMDNHLFKLLLSRIKLLSELKLNVHNEPQEGNFSIKFDDRDIEIRTSILPSQYAEDVALRILDPSTILSLGELGIRKDLLKKLKQYLGAPQGLILVTGPTGSGKTTTLYACVKSITTKDIKVITIEDPIEYRIEGITQTEVNKSGNYTFTTGLKAILRQDPSIILISELRNLESAESALQATLAGRKVFSTLHTTDASGTAPRLIDMGADPSTIASALLVSISQRLIRKLCSSCKEARNLTEQEYNSLQKLLQLLPSDVVTPALERNTQIYSAKKDGCAICDNTGYRGRTGVFEIFSNTKKVANEILKNPTEGKMRSIMREQEETNMLQDAVIKILEGVTSIEEVQRIFGKIK